MFDGRRVFLVLNLVFITIHCQATHREAIVHLDLKGAPPRPSYFKLLLTTLADIGADGVLIEWEDMFPYEGALGAIKNGNAYSYNEALDILQHAESLGLSVIPLVQTIGHLEWILKTTEFADFRENASYPMVACIGDDNVLELILNSLNQVMSLHSKIRMPYIHIGADEVYMMGQCEADKKILPKYDNDKKRLVYDYIKTVGENITQQYPKTQVLMWYDEFKNANHTLIREYGLEQLVTPVVWKYTANLNEDLPRGMWEELARSFSSVWGGSAFKGADGPNRYWNRMKPYIQNNKEWYLQSLEHGDLFTKFQGFFLTGWQRYDHFASLCELLPVSMSSLAINLKLVKNFVLSDVDSEIILRAFKCPSETTINQLIGGEDACRFPGYKVRDSIRNFISIKQQYDNATWIHNRESAYLQRSHMHLNASNPFYTDAIGNSYKKYLDRLDQIIDRLRTSMMDIFYEDVFLEFMTDYINPFYNDLKTRLESVKAIKSRNTYQARPWF